MQAFRRDAHRLSGSDPLPLHPVERCDRDMELEDAQQRKGRLAADRHEPLLARLLEQHGGSHDGLRRLCDPAERPAERIGLRLRSGMQPHAENQQRDAHSHPHTYL